MRHAQTIRTTGTTDQSTSITIRQHSMARFKRKLFRPSTGNSMATLKNGCQFWYASTDLPDFFRHRWGPAPAPAAPMQTCFEGFSDLEIIIFGGRNKDCTKPNPKKYKKETSGLLAGDPIYGEKYIYIYISFSQHCRPPCDTTVAPNSLAALPRRTAVATAAPDSAAKCKTLR